MFQHTDKFVFTVTFNYGFSFFFCLQFKLKQERIAEEEKAEMEKLWKEFEKDPKAFQQD